MLNFVKYLVKLPKTLETDFQDYTKDSKINQKIEKMEATRQYSRDFLDTFYPFFSKEIEKIKGQTRAEEREKAEAKQKKAAEKAEAERKKAAEKSEADHKRIILNLYDLKTFNIEAMLNITGFSEEFIQTTIDDYKESLLKKA